MFSTFKIERETVCPGSDMGKDMQRTSMGVYKNWHDLAVDVINGTFEHGFECERLNLRFGRDPIREVDE